MRLLFLPGAVGSATFWHSVAAHLTDKNETYFFSWPGLGNEPHDPNIKSIDDLVDMVLAKLTQPRVLIAQSMGGYIALRATLKRPNMVTYLVLVATSAGLVMDKFGIVNWRENYKLNFPMAASYIAESTIDLSARLCEITVPCLLIWGGNDPISPVAVGEALKDLLPISRLIIFDDGDHDLAVTHPKQVANSIQVHINASDLDNETNQPLTGFNVSMPSKSRVLSVTTTQL